MHATVESLPGAAVLSETASAGPSPCRPVVVTLVHGTILFARWPRVLRLLRALGRLWSRGPGEPAWYEEGSPFVRGLTASLDGDVRVMPFRWSGGNTVWDRIRAAGADVDFGMRPDEGRPPSLRDHIARVAGEHAGAAQVLVAHSHGGNVCLYALQDAATRRAVRGLACLSTPFVHARQRADSTALTNMLKALGALMYLALFVGLSQWVSARTPEPWDSVVFVSGFSAALMTVTVFWVRGESQRRAVRAWAESIGRPQGDGPPTLVLLSDGDEALLALKIAEGLNVVARGLWRAAFWLPDRVYRAIEGWGSWRLVLYASLSLLVLIVLLLSDAQSPWGPDPGQAWSFRFAVLVLVVAAFAPMVLYLGAALVLAAPALAAMLVGYPALLFSRWLAFGWGGSVDVDITAETCPLGTAMVTRLGARADAAGLRHAHSYNDPGAPGIIAGFVVNAVGAGGAAV